MNFSPWSGRIDPRRFSYNQLTVTIPFIHEPHVGIEKKHFSPAFFSAKNPTSR
ncbi:Hypothetical protein Cul210931_2075 [Corynebacterium ulcerans]|nr:Hypothetical protein Cul210931_2075 [Corynebacterium ulcerans]